MTYRETLKWLSENWNGENVERYVLNWKTLSIYDPIQYMDAPLRLTRAEVERRTGRKVIEWGRANPGQEYYQELAKESGYVVLAVMGETNCDVWILGDKLEVPCIACLAEAHEDPQVAELAPPHTCKASLPKTRRPLSRAEIFARIGSELDRAYAKHGREQWGRHEYYAILKEEVDEMWDAIKKDEPQEELVKEAIQVAAMVFRYLETGDRYREPAKEEAMQ